MFIGFSTRLPGGGRIMFGTTLDKLMGDGKSKREIERDEFSTKVSNTKLEIYDSMLEKANIEPKIFHYADSSDIEIYVNEIFSENNIATIEKIVTLLNKVQELQEKAEFSNTLGTATKEKITNLLFEAKKEVKNIKYEQNAEYKILEKIAKSQNKTIKEVTTNLKRHTRHKSWIIALLLGIFLGWAGADRFYKGDIKFGCIKMITLGGAFMWWIADLYFVPKQIKQNKYKQLSKMQIFLVVTLSLFWLFVFCNLANSQSTEKSANTMSTNIKQGVQK